MKRRTAQMAKLLLDRADALAKVFGKQTVARYDRWDYGGIPEFTKPTADFWQKVAEALAKKTGGLDVGVGWPVERAVKLTTNKCLRRSQHCCRSTRSLSREGRGRVEGLSGIDDVSRRVW